GKVREKGKTATITKDYVLWNSTRYSAPVIDYSDAGIEKIQRLTGIDNIHTSEHSDTRALLDAVIQSKFLEKDKDYIVQGDKIVLVDRSGTGRADSSRRLSRNLHNILEMREGLPLTPEAPLINMTTVRSFLETNYGSIGGTTGTASKEITEEYGLDIVRVPSENQSRRVDSVVPPFDTIDEKLKRIALVATSTITAGKNNKAILIECESVREAEVIEDLVLSYAPSVDMVSTLTAKSDTSTEATIIAEAGQPGRITISAGLASRGTHIAVDKKHTLDVYQTALGPSERNDRQIAGRTGRQGAEGNWYLYTSTEDERPTRNIQHAKEAMDSTSRKYSAAIATKAIEPARTSFLEEFATIKGATPEELRTTLITTLLETAKDEQAAMNKKALFLNSFFQIQLSAILLKVRA
ncbi:MAG: hypothetical protein AAB356_00160, partial [Deltaproteobacteria bacterium]